MEELLIEEKAKRYDSMFERLKEMYNNNKTNVAARLICERYFPELKESEDERIRKGLLYVIEHHPTLPTEEAEEYIAWLEKQGEQKPVIIPKFRVGDYVKDTNYHGEPIYKICNIDSQCYICVAVDGTNLGDRGVMHFSFDNPYLRFVEQKPVKWRPSKEVMDVLYSLCYVSDIIDEHKDTVLTKLYQELKREYFNSASYENMFPKEEKIKQSLAKWNEEDDKKLSSIIDLTNYAQDTWSKKYMIEVRDWLKSLRPQKHEDLPKWRRLPLSNVSYAPDYWRVMDVITSTVNGNSTSVPALVKGDYYVPLFEMEKFISKEA